MTIRIPLDSRHEMSNPTGVATVPSVVRELHPCSPALAAPSNTTVAARRTTRGFGISLRRLAAAARAGLSAAAICVLALALQSPTAAADLVQSGTVTIEQVQIAFIGSGNLGGGTLSVGGRQYSFSVGGLGVGGIGVSKMEASGTVYNLKNINDFAGAYLQARSGIAIGSLSSGGLWLQNSHGVVLELRARRQGLALSLGGDAVYIDFD
jgi:hypothetical protein